MSTPTYTSLAKRAARATPSREDTVIARVYFDTVPKDRIVTCGEIVVPGEDTKRAFPRTRGFQFHFRKTFTPESRPIQRGETPKVEFDKTVPIHRRFPGHVPEPLGYEQWVYRCTTVCGRTFNAMSPFADISYERALGLTLDRDRLVPLHGNH